MKARNEKKTWLELKNKSLLILFATVIGKYSLHGIKKGVLFYSIGKKKQQEWNHRSYKGGYQNKKTDKTAIT